MAGAGIETAGEEGGEGKISPAPRAQTKARVGQAANSPPVNAGGSGP